MKASDFCVHRAHKKSRRRTGFVKVLSERLYGEAFATSAGAAGIGIIKKEAFTIQAVRKVQHRIYQIQEAF